MPYNQSGQNCGLGGITPLHKISRSLKKFIDVNNYILQRNATKHA